MPDTSYPSTNALPLSDAGAAPAASAPSPAHVVSKDPFARGVVSVQVHTSAGDSPVVKTAPYAFRSLDPYARPEGINPSPATPQEAAVK